MNPAARFDVGAQRYRAAGGVTHGPQDLHLSAYMVLWVSRQDTQTGSAVLQ